MRSLFPENVERYVESLASARQSDVERRLREETAKMKSGGMQIGPDQATFFAILVRAMGARRALEIGTFTGYSALAVASALPADGKLVCCDVSDEWTQVARRYWREAKLADKTGYDGYYERCLTLVRPGGLIAFDNTLWSGAVVDPARNDDDTKALRALNTKAHADPRVDAVLLTIGDGVLLVRRK